jgi:hypothetical protein
VLFILSGDYSAFHYPSDEHDFGLTIHENDICYVIKYTHSSNGRSLVLHHKHGLVQTFVSEERGRIVMVYES